MNFLIIKSKKPYSVFYIKCSSITKNICEATYKTYIFLSFKCDFFIGEGMVSE